MMGPPVATTSLSSCALPLRTWCDHDTSANEKHRIGENGAADAAYYLSCNISRYLVPRSFVAKGFGERHDGIKVPARDGAKDRDQAEESTSRCDRIVQKRDGRVAPGKSFRHDAGADHSSH